MAHFSSSERTRTHPLQRINQRIRNKKKKEQKRSPRRRNSNANDRNGPINDRTRTSRTTRSIYHFFDSVLQYILRQQQQPPSDVFSPRPLHPPLALVLPGHSPVESTLKINVDAKRCGPTSDDKFTFYFSRPVSHSGYILASLSSR